MKKTRQITKSLAVLLFLSANIFAVDLKNEDSRRYEVKIYEGAGTLNTWIDGNTTSPSICSDCEIEVVGVGRIKVKGSEIVVIKDGKLTKQ
jgi:hypothetical protein